MCKDNTKAAPSTYSGRVQAQVRAGTFTVQVPGVGAVQATARNASLRPGMAATVLKVGSEWRVV